MEKRHLRLAAPSGGAAVAALGDGSAPRCAWLKLCWMSSKVPAPGRSPTGGGGARLLSEPPIATALTRAACCAVPAAGTSPGPIELVARGGEEPVDLVVKHLSLTNTARTSTRHPGPGDGMNACRFCGSCHASKTKLFTHLRESYACAAAAVAENPEAATSLCRDMSRARRSWPCSWSAEAGWSLGQPEVAPA
eukprot:scaffold27185_cov55-Phaeocystis_antarctica.AAC.4